MRSNLGFALLLLLGWGVFTDTHAAVQTRPWTVLVYWAVDNDLYEFSKPYLQQFEQVPQTDDLAIVVEYDYPDQRPTQRIQIRQSTYTVLEDIGEKNSADPATLRDFISYAANQFPSERTLLIIGSHGSNWSGVIDDTTSKKFMPLADLRSAFSGSKIDLLLFDACKMSFLETMVGLKDIIKNFVGSPYDVNGFDHAVPLKKLAENPKLSTEELGKLYVSAYPVMPENKEFADISASLVDMSTAGELIQSLEFFFSHLKQKDKLLLSLLHSKIKSTINEDKDLAYDVFEIVQKAGEMFVDLRVFSELLKHQFGSLGNSPVLFQAMNSLTLPHSGLGITCAQDQAAYESSYAGQKLVNWSEICKVWNPIF